MNTIYDDSENDYAVVSDPEESRQVYCSPYDTYIESYLLNLESLHSLYRRYNFTECLSISKSYRALNCINTSTMSYGEIHFEHFGLFILNLFKSMDFDTNNGMLTFVDIGCGSGKAIFSTYMMNIFVKCTGIELLTDLYKTCMSVSRDYQKHFLDSPNDIMNIHFILGDATYIDWSTHDVAFAYATGFDRAMMDRLAATANKMRCGAVFISLSQCLPSPVAFDLVTSAQLQVAGHDDSDPNIVTAYVYRRNDKSPPGVELDTRVRLTAILSTAVPIEKCVKIC